MATQPVVYIQGKPEPQDVGTTLNDLRESFPHCHLVEKDTTIPHRAANFVLQNVEYILVEAAPSNSSGTFAVATPKITLTEFLSQGHIPYQLSTTVDTNPNMMIMKFTLTNEYNGVEKDASLLIDEGAMKELIIPAREAKRLGLQPSSTIPPFPISGVGGIRSALTMVPSLLVSCKLISRDGIVVEEKRDYLYATVWSDSWDKVKEDSAVAVGQSQPHSINLSPPPEKKKKDGPPLYTKLSPVKHIPDSEREAVIGKPGLAKLGLFIDPKQNRVYMFREDNPPPLELKDIENLDQMESS